MWKIANTVRVGARAKRVRSSSLLAMHHTSCRYYFFTSAWKMRYCCGNGGVWAQEGGIRGNEGQKRTEI